MDASEFYTGLVADLYTPLKASTMDAAPYARFIETFGQPALELGCGGGEPLLDLLAMGLDVQGLDSSADMLERCRANAAARGLGPLLHHASMADFTLDQRFASIYLAGPTFNLLPDDATALAALGRIRAHLTDDGAALVPLFIPSPTPGLGEFRETTDALGARLRFAAISEERDESARVQTTMTRYERIAADGTEESLERPWVLHWHTRDDFRALAAAAELNVVTIIDDPGGFAFILNR